MSDVVTALNGASWDAGIARVEGVPLQGMITLRGDFGSKALQAAAEAAAGVSFPDVRSAQCNGDSGLCWMSPDELLVLCPYAEVEAKVSALSDALKDSHFLAANVSDARASFRVSGPHARDVMAKLCPVDVSPAAFGPGDFRRSRMAQVPAAFWMCDSDTFQIICFRSQAQYVFDLLKVAAQPGSEIN
ncbi:MAG: sarcosine oxidase subunit gamma [Rhodobacteraceae bacterium]|nr:sarcosine oxidase subunit gamma [Paracoccaceae bacterium]